MNRKKRLEELTQKNPTHKKLLDNNNKINEQAIKITNAIENSPMGELMEMQYFINAKSDKFNPEGDYSVINFNGEDILLSQTQALAIKYIYEEHKKGRKSIFIHDILDACYTKETSLHRLFKKKNIMRNLILKRKNTYYYLDI